MYYILQYYLYLTSIELIGYSQGGLIARGMLEVYGDKHNVKTFVSLSSPQGGQYGGMYFYFTCCTNIDRIISVNSH